VIFIYFYRFIRRFQESGLIIRWSRKVISETRKHEAKAAAKNGIGLKTDIDRDNDDEDDEAANYDSKKRRQRVFTTEDLQVTFFLQLVGWFRC